MGWPAAPRPEAPECLFEEVGERERGRDLSSSSFLRPSASSSVPAPNPTLTLCGRSVRLGDSAQGVSAGTSTAGMTQSTPSRDPGASVGVRGGEKEGETLLVADLGGDQILGGTCE